MRGTGILFRFESYCEQSLVARCLTFKRTIMKKYICTVCQWVYDPEIGDPEQGIEPGTPFESLPDDYVCPLCGVGKEDFEEEN